VLYFDGCPTYRAAEETLRGVFAQEEVEADVELEAVNTDEEAQRPRFPGSLTIRIDGENLFPVPARAGYALGCRMCAIPEGLGVGPRQRWCGQRWKNATSCRVCRSIGQDHRHWEGEPA
jgi:hypothetical protein